MQKIKIGVIADDFTGASDAASFLIKGGNKTILLTDIPKKLDFECNSIVLALKIRSVEPDEAISQVKSAIEFFNKIGTDKIYYKYCSTFDSTPTGNIGIVLDYLLEYYQAPYTLLCPSLPVNGRIVKNDILYVNGVELAKSPMKNHPLNPMWDSRISELMRTQSKYKCFTLSSDDLKNGNYAQKIENYKKMNKHFYLVPDYVEDEDAKLIANSFNDLKIYSGGSGLLEYLCVNSCNYNLSLNYNDNKSIILCGSCSMMTSKQVNFFKNTDNCYYTIDSNKLVNDEISVLDIFNLVESNQPKTTLIYSDGCEIKLNREDEKFKEKAKKLEEFLSTLALKANDSGYTKIIVGGGETSGAVTLKLGYNAFYVGKSIAPGVPILIPVENQNVRLVLKSGNFGNEDFFIKALEV